MPPLHNAARQSAAIVTSHEDPDKGLHSETEHNRRKMMAQWHRIAEEATPEQRDPALDTPLDSVPEDSSADAGPNGYRSRSTTPQTSELTPLSPMPPAPSPSDGLPSRAGGKGRAKRLSSVSVQFEKQLDFIEKEKKQEPPSKFTHRVQKAIITALTTDGIKDRNRVEALERAYLVRHNRRRRNNQILVRDGEGPSTSAPTPAEDEEEQHQRRLSVGLATGETQPLEVDDTRKRRNTRKSFVDALRLPEDSPIKKFLTDGLGSTLVDPDTGEKYGPNEVYNLLKLHTWILLSDPDSSRAAYLTSIGILCFILISSVTFCMETMSQFESDQSLKAFAGIETFCIIVFTSEYVLKFLSAPNRWRFVKGMMNIVDLVAILPYYLEALASSVSLGNTRILRVVRLVRVFRILKLGGRYGKIQVVAKAVMESMDMLGMMLFLLVISIIIFSALIYFTEKGTWDPELERFVREDESKLDEYGNPISSPFRSIPDSFWWCMVTLMTVGYGEIFPVTTMGKVVASLAMIVSVLILALPISVIGTNFTQAWMEYKEKEKYKDNRRLCPTFIELSRRFGDHCLLLEDLLKKTTETENELSHVLIRLRDRVQQEKRNHPTTKRTGVKALLDLHKDVKAKGSGKPGLRQRAGSNSGAQGEDGASASSSKGEDSGDGKGGEETATPSKGTLKWMLSKGKQVKDLTLRTATSFDLGSREKKKDGEDKVTQQLSSTHKLKLKQRQRDLKENEELGAKLKQHQHSMEEFLAMLEVLSGYHFPQVINRTRDRYKAVDHVCAEAQNLTLELEETGRFVKKMRDQKRTRERTNSIAGASRRLSRTFTKVMGQAKGTLAERKQSDASPSKLPFLEGVGPEPDQPEAAALAPLSPQEVPTTPRMQVTPLDDEAGRQKEDPPEDPPSPAASSPATPEIPAQSQLASLPSFTSPVQERPTPAADGGPPTVPRSPRIDQAFAEARGEGGEASTSTHNTPSKQAALPALRIPVPPQDLLSAARLDAPSPSPSPAVPSSMPGAASTPSPAGAAPAAAPAEGDSSPPAGAAPRASPKLPAPSLASPLAGLSKALSLPPQVLPGGISRGLSPSPEAAGAPGSVPSPGSTQRDAAGDRTQRDAASMLGSVATINDAADAAVASINKAAGAASSLGSAAGASSSALVPSSPRGGGRGALPQPLVREVKSAVTQYEKPIGRTSGGSGGQGGRKAKAAKLDDTAHGGALTGTVRSNNLRNVSPAGPGMGALDLMEPPITTTTTTTTTITITTTSSSSALPQLKSNADNPEAEEPAMFTTPGPPIQSRDERDREH